jgi:hypothetical protein
MLLGYILYPAFSCKTTHQNLIQITSRCPIAYRFNVTGSIFLGHVAAAQLRRIEQTGSPTLPTTGPSQISHSA